jgi:hypothetical protein
MGLASYANLSSNALHLPVRFLRNVGIQKTQRMFWTFSSDPFGCPTAPLDTPVPVPFNCFYQRRFDGRNGASDLFWKNRSIHCSFSGGFMVNRLISHSDADTHTHTHTHTHKHVRTQTNTRGSSSVSN